MGASQQRQQQLAVYRPQLQNYTLAHVYSPLNIYRHLYTSEEIMEFKQHFYHTQDIDRKLLTFTARYQHAYLVASLYLQLSGTDTCGAGEYELSVYYERVVTNLSKINDIPFMDSIHCLAVALKGFQILFRSYGYFQIFEDMFHICQRGKMKVWCNRQIYKNVPEQYLLGGGREEDMVAKVINIIDMNTDPNGKLLSFKDSLMSIHGLTFANAMAAFRQICRQNHFYVSEYLESLHNAAQIQNILDIYGPLEDKPQKQIAMTFYPKKDVALPSKTAQHVRSGSSSRRSQHIIPEDRGRSLDVSRHRHGFQLTIAQPDFPQFVVNRNKTATLSKSRSSPQTESRNRVMGNLPIAPSQHLNTGQPINLQQFHKGKMDVSRLRKRNMLSNQSSRPIVRFVHGDNSNSQLPLNLNSSYKFANSRSNIPQQMETSLVSPMITLDAKQLPQYLRREKAAGTQPLSTISQIQTAKRQSAYPIHYHPQSQSQPLINQQPLIYLQPAHQKQSQSPIRSQMRQQVVSRPSNLTSNQYNSPVKREDSNQTSRQQYSRGLSVPLTPTWKTPTTPPEKQKVNKQTVGVQYSNPSNEHPKLLTFGDGSVQKTAQFYTYKEDRFNLPQLQSKIELISSFADNRITTQQFIPNQSRALSIVKFQKSINSGRDSVSSVFRRDLLEQSRKDATKHGEGESKREEMGTKRQFKPYAFDYNNYETDPKLLELIKSTTATYKASQFAKNSSFEERFRKYQVAYPKSDKIKQVSKEQTSDTQGERKTEQTDNFTPIFSGNQPYDPTSFRRKHDLFINKISEISENWEEQNICSTSQGSRKQRTNFATATLDQDILEDMAKMGMAVGRKAP